MSTVLAVRQAIVGMSVCSRHAWQEIKKRLRWRCTRSEYNEGNASCETDCPRFECPGDMQQTVMAGAMAGEYEEVVVRMNLEGVPSCAVAVLRESSTFVERVREEGQGGWRVRARLACTQHPCTLITNVPLRIPRASSCS